MSSLSIAVVTETHPPEVNGVAMTVGRLIEGLRGRGHRVSVLRPRQSREDRGGEGDLLLAGLPLPGYAGLRFGLPAGGALTRVWRARRPDVVHVVTEGPLGWSAVAAARKLGLPVTSGFHTNFDRYSVHYGLGWLRPAVEQRLRAFYASCDFVLAPTPAIAERLRAEGLGERMRVWARGVDRDLFDPARRDMAWRRAQGFDDGRPVVVSFGRLVMEKNLAAFADAIDLVEAAQGPAQVLVVGDGPARAWMEQRLPRAVFTGFLSGQDLAAAIAAGDILLNPSKTETFGNVTLEAMASGLAILAADAPNHRAILRDGRDGLLRPAGDAAACAAALAVLVGDREARTRLGRAARERALQFRWDDILDHVAGVYREATANGVAPGQRRLAPNSHRQSAAKATAGAPTAAGAGS